MQSADVTDMTAELKLRQLDAPVADASIAALADVLLDCVDGGASVGFMAPLARSRALAFWRGVADGVARGERKLLVALDAQERIVGTVQLVLAAPDNQQHRADVAKLLVRRAVRRQGIAHRLLAAVEAAALAMGRTVLVLDTVTGGDAERVYERAGWCRVGVVPRYALMPAGDFCSTTFFYKLL